jgi:ketosteroid isomerase-like protein
MTDQDRLQDVYATMDAIDAAFAAGDLHAWTAADHPLCHSFQGDHFTGGAELGEVTDAQAATSDEWKTLWREGVVEGDAACVWGEVEWALRAGDEGHVARLACSWYWVKVGDEWKVLFSHYTPLSQSSA